MFAEITRLLPESMKPYSKWIRFSKKLCFYLLQKNINMTDQFDLKNKLGVMQGRLSPIINGKIQSFPWQNWKNEFYDLYDLNINLVEWTIDQENLYENPIRIVKIKLLSKD